MKKKLFTPLILIPLLLTGCNIQLFPSSSSDDESQEESSSIPLGNSVGFVAKDSYTDYKIGDVYKEHAKLAFYEKYSSGQEKKIDVLRYTINSIYYNDSVLIGLDDKFDRSGNYTVNVSFSYNLATRNATCQIYVQGGEELNYSANAITILNSSYSAIVDDYVDLTSLEYKISYTTGSEIIDEYFDYDESQTFVTVSLFKNGNTNTNVINEKIAIGNTYVLNLKHNKSLVTSNINLNVLKSRGYYQIDEPTMVSTDYSDRFAPSQGDVKILVIPIELPIGSLPNYYNWSDDYVQFVNNAYFGTVETNKGWNSFSTYYSRASFGNVSFSGMVAPVYYETDETYSMSNINDDKTYQTLFTVLDRALTYTKDTNPDIDWSEYDLNKDGAIDSIHFISNAGSSVKWNEPLWPHMYNTGVFGTPSDPSVNTYSMSSLAHFSSARTQIHEQGHIFGLEDYYDYTEDSTIDYIGGADMQSYNVFDWNSYSKFSMGWVKPYVIDGSLDSTTITLSAASINGDCLIIPADVSTFNNSAFDEYFLLELFSPYGNNEYDWNNNGSIFGLTSSDFGVKLYHVDSRLYAHSYYNINNGYLINTREELDEELKSSSTQVIIGPNNSYDASAYAYPSPTSLEDFKLITLIQSKKVNTLGTSKSTLEPSDLFHTGDVFSFSDYSKFLTKSNTSVSTMDNGEDFPYIITFDKVEKNKVTVTVSKVA